MNARNEVIQVDAQFMLENLSQVGNYTTSGLRALVFLLLEGVLDVASDF